MIAPRRAIGVLPSSASNVMLGGVGGWSDFDSGAVTASQPTASTNSMMIASAEPAHDPAQPPRPPRDRSGWIGVGIGFGAIPQVVDSHGSAT